VPPKKLTKDQIIALLMEGGVGIKYEGPPEQEPEKPAEPPPPAPQHTDRWPELVDRLNNGFGMVELRLREMAQDAREEAKLNRKHLVTIVILVLLFGLASLLIPHSWHP
jgi:hypothetical protein